MNALFCTKAQLNGLIKNLFVGSDIVMNGIQDYSPEELTFTSDHKHLYDEVGNFTEFTISLTDTPVVIEVSETEDEEGYPFWGWQIRDTEGHLLADPIDVSEDDDLARRLIVNKVHEAF